MSGLGTRWFSLVLMHRMRDINTRKVEETLAAIGVRRAELRAAHTQWAQMAYAINAPKGAEALRVVLGPPASSAHRTFGDLHCRIQCWKLPLWPDLTLEVLLAPDRSVWNLWLTRPGQPKPFAFEDLVPWSAVVGDLAASFADADQGEGSAPHHWTVRFTHGGVGYRARFVYGLLQAIEPIAQHGS